ncbi:MAG TPA: hypothetical protein VFA70_15200 [Dehalococcoidia bacterium]|jgi:hypothetical protein|nr:hypothetical protein [Dehalococcoidia bacterium]
MKPGPLLSRRAAACLALGLLGLAGLCLAVVLTHPSDNAYLGLDFVLVACVLLSAPFLLAALLPGAAAQGPGLAVAVVILVGLLLVGCLLLFHFLAIVPLGVLLLLLLTLAGTMLLLRRR